MKNRLPKSYGDTLILALADEAKVHRMKGVEIDMREWAFFNSEGDLCTLCLGGAVLRLSLDITTRYILEKGAPNWRLPKRDANMIRFLDEIRRYCYYNSSIKSQCHWWSVAKALDDLELDETPHDKDRLKWRRNMFKIARELQRLGV